MICSVCNSQNAYDASFCWYCGTQLIGAVNSSSYVYPTSPQQYYAPPAPASGYYPYPQPYQGAEQAFYGNPPPLQPYYAPPAPASGHNPYPYQGSNQALYYDPFQDPDKAAKMMKMLEQLEAIIRADHMFNVSDSTVINENTRFEDIAVINDNLWYHQSFLLEIQGKFNVIISEDMLRGTIRDLLKTIVERQEQLEFTRKIMKEEDKLHGYIKSKAKAKWNAIITKQIPLDNALLEAEVFILSMVNPYPEVMLIWMNKGKPLKYNVHIGDCLSALERIFPEARQRIQALLRGVTISKELHDIRELDEILGEENTSSSSSSSSNSDDLSSSEGGTGILTTEEAIRRYEKILYDPYSSPQQKAIAEIALKSLRGY